MIVVCNSTPLVHLSAMGQLGLLKRLFNQVHLAEAVYQEVVVRGAGKPGAAELGAADWIKRHEVANQMALNSLRARLGEGEAASIVLAEELRANVLVLDDKAARLQAKSQSLKVTGTVGLLLLADERGMLSFPKALERLLDTGFHLSQREQQRVLAIWEAGQTTPPWGREP